MDETREGEQQPLQPNNPLPNTESAPALPPEESSADSSFHLKQIRTFQGDVANALHDQKESLFSIQQTERLKRSSGRSVAPEPEPANPEQKRAAVYLLAGLALAAAGTFAAWFGYSQYAKKTAPPVIAAPASRFISPQDETDINFASTTRETLVAAVTEKSAGTAAGSITHLVMRQGSASGAPLATTAQFLAKLNAQAPGNLVRAFDPLFMIGSLGSHRFLIIKVSSFENAFPGMLAWEADMAADIGPLFASNEALKTIPSDSVFTDVISKNKDVRVLAGTGTSTEPLLLYTFFENRLLIITDGLDALQTIVDRLAQELLSR